jgi:hypothetical protein
MTSKCTGCTAFHGLQVRLYYRSDEMYFKDESRYGILKPEIYFGYSYTDSCDLILKSKNDQLCH